MAGGQTTRGWAGTPTRIRSPGTAKNVITVGAVEQARNITNEVWGYPGDPSLTNEPWFWFTDSYPVLLRKAQSLPTMIREESMFSAVPPGLGSMARVPNAEALGYSHMSLRDNEPGICERHCV